MADNRAIQTTVDRVVTDSHRNDQALTTIRQQHAAPQSASSALVQQFANQPLGREMQTTTVHPRTRQQLTVSTLTPASHPTVARAAAELADDARAAKQQQHTEAQKAWLSDIMKPTWSRPTQGAKVMEHVQNTRRLEESARVFDTISMTAEFGNFPVKFSAVTGGGRLQGLMQSTGFDSQQGRVVPSQDLAIGFLGTHPRNISGPDKVQGVGTALINHANEMGRTTQKANISLGAEGQEAQGFYQNQGFTHADGRRLDNTHFTSGTLALKRRIR